MNHWRRAAWQLWDRAGKGAREGRTREDSVKLGRINHWVWGEARHNDSHILKNGKR